MILLLTSGHMIIIRDNTYAIRSYVALSVGRPNRTIMDVTNGRNTPMINDMAPSSLSLSLDGDDDLVSVDDDVDVDGDSA